MRLRRYNKERIKQEGGAEHSVQMFYTEAVANDLAAHSKATKKTILPSVVFSLQTTEGGLDHLFPTILALLI